MGKGKALIAIEATLIDFEARMGMKKNLLKKLYKIEIPSQDATPGSIIKALNLAAKEFSERLRDDIRAAVEPKVPEPEKKPPRKAPHPSPDLRKPLNCSVGHINLTHAVISCATVRSYGNVKDVICPLN